MSNSEEPVIVIYMEGGLIQCIESTTLGMKALVVDYDTEGIEEEEIVKLDGDDATVALCPIDVVNPEHVQAVVNIYDKHEREVKNGSQQLP